MSADKFPKMMNDPSLTVEDKNWIIQFEEAAEQKIKKDGFTDDISLFGIASKIGMDLSCLHKEGPLMYALWFSLLCILKKYLDVQQLKYPTIEQFLAAYPGWFVNECETEKQYLWQTANWMTVLFQMITARKNKGLVMQVIPKVVEGWDAKYVTGSGQKRATANRVHIFEVEGNTKANQRGKLKAKKKAAELGEEFGVEDLKVKKKRKPISSPFTSASEVAAIQSLSSAFTTSASALMNAPFTFTAPIGTVSQYRDNRLRGVSALESTNCNYYNNIPLNRNTFTDEEENESYNDDIKKTFSQWQATMALQRDESIGLGLSLSRSSSYLLNNGLSGNVEQQLSTPHDYQRGFSWTEIPILPSTSNGNNSILNNSIISSALSSAATSFPYCNNYYTTTSGTNTNANSMATTSMGLLYNSLVDLSPVEFDTNSNNHDNSTTPTLETNDSSSAAGANANSRNTSRTSDDTSSYLSVINNATTVPFANTIVSAEALSDMFVGYQR